MSLTLTVHRGTRQIGGSYIEIAHPAGDRLILDAERPLDAPDGAGGQEDRTDPEAVERLSRLEAGRGPEWAAVALAEQRTAELLADRESKHGSFAYWWRPARMYLNLYA